MNVGVSPGFGSVERPLSPPSFQFDNFEQRAGEQQSNDIMLPSSSLGQPCMRLAPGRGHEPSLIYADAFSSTQSGRSGTSKYEICVISIFHHRVQPISTGWLRSFIVVKADSKEGFSYRYPSKSALEQRDSACAISQSPRAPGFQHNFRELTA